MRCYESPLYVTSPKIVVTDFKALWRGIAVDHLDEKKIEEYLSKHGEWGET